MGRRNPGRPTPKDPVATAPENAPDTPPPGFEPGFAADGENTPKTILRPRNPGERLKVNEVVLRRRDTNLKIRAERAAKVAQVKRDKMKYERGKISLIRMERLVKNARLKLQDQRRIKTIKKKWPNPKINNRGPKTLCVIRNSRLGGCKETKSTLRYLNLKKRNHCVFVRNSNDTKRRLMLVRPYAFWGPVSFKTVFNLVHKKGMFNAPVEWAPKVMLSDNTLIEKHLGHLGCLCTEDLAHVLHTGAESFEKVNKRLWPFEMDDAKTAFAMVRDQHFTFGDLQGAMDAKVAEMIGST